MTTTKPTVHADIYYWPSYAAAESYAQSVGVTVHHERGQWPRFVSYGRGIAIQLERSGAYLSSQHVAIATR